MKKNKKLVLGIVLGVLLISGITYAILTWTSDKINIGLTSNCFTIEYTKGNDINNATINLLNEEDLISNNKFTIKEGMALTYANIGIKSSCTIEGYGSLYLNITSLSDAFTTGSSKGSLKYAVLKNTSSVNTISIDNLKDQSFDIIKNASITEIGQIRLLTEQLSNTLVNKYLIAIYIDNSLTGNDVVGATFNGTVSADANQGKEPVNAVSLITDLYNNASKTPVINNNITYQYDTAHNLMKDVGGNIRYYGAEPEYAWQTVGSVMGNQYLGRSFTSEEDCINGVEQLGNCSTNYSNLGFSSQSECEKGLPSLLNNITNGSASTLEQVKELYCSKKIAELNNYIYFNCSDYTNQSSSTCETWRIIGVIDGKVKLIRDGQIGAYSWDNKDTTTGAEDENGKNDWTDARLMKLLNPGYESETIGGSLYYNAKSGSCYSEQNNAVRACDFTNIGIKNDTTRNMVSETIYYLGGYDNEEIFSNQVYEYEKGAKVYSGNSTIWKGRIALPYPSDYGYAADLKKCNNKKLSNYDENICISNNWMKNIMAISSYSWLLTPYYSVSDIAWFIHSSGLVGDFDTYNSLGIIPVLYLKPELDIKSGTGSSSDPYQLNV